MSFTALRQLSVHARVDAAVQQAQALQPKLNALVSFVEPDAQLEALNLINTEAPLYGMPIVLKDVVNMKGTRTTGSSALLDNYVSPYNATIVEKLQAAGAIVIGKSACDTFGMGGTNMTAHTGPVPTPYDLERMAGGSSGGSAALVAAGVVPMAIGTDTGDSIRKPASFNQVVGLKPSYGRISRYGIIPYASSLDHVGVFTRNVYDAALSLTVLAGRDERDFSSLDHPVRDYTQDLKGNLNGARLGVLANVIETISQPETLALWAAQLEKLQAAGATIVSVRLDDALMKAFLPTYYIIANAEATANHANLDGVRFGVSHPGLTLDETMIETRTQGFGFLLKKRFVIGSYALFSENQERIFRKAQKVRRLIVEDLKRALTEVDGLIAPASTQGAPRFDAPSMDALSNTYLIAENYMALANFSGYPSITVPMGTVEGLPVGINLTCGAFEDAKLLDLATGIERVNQLKDQIAKGVV
jgi:aspartyl-tRNA(Asn)/glutamyl-tRNA(Gln) amidotransferase subunit A